MLSENKHSLQIAKMKWNVFQENETMVYLWKVLGSERLLIPSVIMSVKLVYLRNCKHCTFSKIRLQTRIKLNLSSHCSDHIVHCNGNPFMGTAILRTWRLKLLVMYYLNIRGSFK